MRQGAVFADIGTDHAHLPIFLLKTGKIARAVAADVNEGPLDRARRNAMSEGVAEKIDFRLANGLAGMDELGLTDIAICGMGGELIAAILSGIEHDVCRKRRKRNLKSPGLASAIEDLTCKNIIGVAEKLCRI